MLIFKIDVVVLKIKSLIKKYSIYIRATQILKLLNRPSVKVFFDTYVLKKSTLEVLEDL